MSFTLPELPFDPSTFGSFLSKETFDYHHGKHHAGYVTKLNAALEGSDHTDKPLEQIIADTRGKEVGLFNNAAQHFNHSFFWNSLSSEEQDIPEALSELIVRDFESIETFKEVFSKTATTLFGSGWVWLVKNAEGKLNITKSSNAETPIGHGDVPLLTLDVWEHAYYIDHRNARPEYIEKFWEYVNWEFVVSQLS